jgi:hypothetical protein
MSEKFGWIFWIDHNGTVRNFTVGVENEDAAKLEVVPLPETAG